MITVIPRLYRFAIAIIAAIATLTAFVIFGTRALRTDYGCLYLDGETSAMLDVNWRQAYTYPVTQAPNVTIFSNNPNALYVLSPDAKRVATFKDSTSNMLFVQTFQHPLPAIMQVSDFSTEHDITSSDILWSPNGQYVAYHWRNGATHYLAIADANGTLLRQTKLNLSASDLIGFDSWSADSKYIALVANINDFRMLSFWSVPDLQQFDMGEDGHEVGASCEEPGMAGSWWYCAPWSLQGHDAAFTLTKSDGSVQLVITTPDASTKRVFDLPTSRNQTIRFSPDGKWVAVGSYNPGSDYSARSAQIDLYGVDGTVRANIGKAIEANVGVSDTSIYTEMSWSANGSSLFYAQLKTADQSQYDLMRYQVDAGKTTRLFTEANTWPNETFFYPSPDGQTVAVIINDLTLISLTDNSHFTVPKPDIGSVHWSPNSSMIAYRIDNTVTHEYSVDVISNKGQTLAEFQQASAIFSINWTQCDLP